jgi:hypothetical protein
MKIYKYKDYNEYVEAQTITNKKKINWVYVKKETVKKISEDKKTAENIICHGTRNGAEQKYFLELFPDAYIIGTEISDTASDFPMTIQHDFTIQKKEWVGKFDIVYSNSFDHSIDPEKTIKTWTEQLSDNGKLYLEYSELFSVCEYGDPLEATAAEVQGLIKKYLTIEKIIPDTGQGGSVFVCVKNG